MQQTACLVVNPITVVNFAFVFNCTLAGQTSDYDCSDLKLHSLWLLIFLFWSNVSIFQEHIKKLKFRYTFYQFRKSLQIISIKTTAFMLKLDCQ